ncbi:MAG: ATP-binding protein [Burkholderiales bacterium]|nr:ATP-binding protein [Phycisphaerae bacterium]
MRKIVLTGGPGAGKTVIARRLAADYPQHFILVPEAATEVYSRRATRWDKLDIDGRRDMQRMIYRHQIAQEESLASAHPDKTLLLDRGTMDGAAYWPDGAAAYWQDLHTTPQRELARYDHVIWLETAAALGIYDGSASNPVRFESPAAAVESGRVLLALWGDHPHLHHVGAFVSLEDKIAAVLEILEPHLT